MLLFVALLGWMVELVPLTVLAGLLVFVGAKLVHPGHIRELRKRGQLDVYVVTVTGVVFINLLAGIGLGLAMAQQVIRGHGGRIAARNGHPGEAERHGACFVVTLPILAQGSEEKGQTAAPVA